MRQQNEKPLPPEDLQRRRAETVSAAVMRASKVTKAYRFNTAAALSDGSSEGCGRGRDFRWTRNR